MTEDSLDVVEARPLTAEEEAEARAWHVDDAGHRARKPECLTCALFATLDAARQPAPALLEALRAWLIDQSRQAHDAADHPDGQPGDPGGYFDKGAAHMADGVLSWLGDHVSDSPTSVETVDRDWLDEFTIKRLFDGVAGQEIDKDDAAEAMLKLWDAALRRAASPSDRPSLPDREPSVIDAIFGGKYDGVTVADLRRSFPDPRPSPVPEDDR